MTSPNSNYTQVSAITRKYFVPKLFDNIFLGNPLLKRAKDKGWYKTIDGGTEIVIPLEYAINGASDWYSGADTLDLSDAENMTAASINWKQLYAPITISRLDELKNMGESRVVDFVKAKMMNAEKTLRRKLSVGIYSDGSDADSIVGLRSWVNADETVGGISQASNSWYQAQEDTTTTTLTLSAMQTQYNAASEDDEAPSVITATKANFNRYYALLQPQQRFVDTESCKGGFTSLMFNGIPVISDSNCPSGYMFFLNEKHLHLFAHKAENMRMTDFDQVTNQNVKVAKIFWAGAMGCSNNRYQADFTSISA